LRILFCGDTFPSARVLLQNRLPHDGLGVWHDRATVIEAANVDVLIPMMFSIDAAVLDAIRPRLIQQWGSGLDGVNLAAARARGVPVSRVPTSGSNAESVAEHALLLMLSLLRELPAAQANVRAGILGAPMGRMLAGRTVCLWGLGATALSLARRLRALDVNLLGITRNPGAAKVAAFGLDACFSTEMRDECLRRADVLVLCVRLNHETRGLVDGRVFSTLREGAFLVNAARGALLDYRALCTALSSGRLAGAGLDVYWEEPISPDDPLLALPNVIATPHVAGVTDRSYGEIADAVVTNIERLRRGEPLLNCVA
jgi:phosphoglycerate dehydrogenase-like enzyme